jgi:hypothetical protein
VAAEALRGGGFGMLVAKVLAHGVVSSYVITHRKADSSVDGWESRHPKLRRAVGFSCI